MDSRLLPSRSAHDTAGRHEENTAGVTFALRPYRVAGCRFDAVVLGGAPLSSSARTSGTELRVLGAGKVLARIEPFASAAQ